MEELADGKTPLLGFSWIGRHGRHQGEIVYIRDEGEHHFTDPAQRFAQEMTWKGQGARHRPVDLPRDGSAERKCDPHG